MVPGAPLADAPVQRADGTPGWLLRETGAGFTLLVFGDAPAWAAEMPELTTLAIGRELIDAHGLVTRRLDGQPGTAYLIRPDQHVCARWRQPTPAAVRAALQRATACA